MERSLAADTPPPPGRRGRPGKVTALALIGVGLALIALSMAADALDIGGGEGFGYQQLIGVIVGLALILGAVALLTRAASTPGADAPIDLDGA